MLRDVIFSLRTLRRQPTFAAAIVLTLAIGIGATAAVFSILNAVLLRDLPYKDPGELYMLRTAISAGMGTGLVAPRFVEPLYETHPSVEAAAICFLRDITVLDRQGAPFKLARYNVTYRFFDVFKQPLAMGRGFARNEPLNSVVISFATWKNLFGSNPDILGTPIRVDGAQRIVVGVASDGFEFPRGADAWTPLVTGGALQNLVNYEGYLRLRPGVSRKQFEAELAILSKELGPNPGNKESAVFVLRPLLEEVVGDLRPTILIVFGATGILLLIACLNVASLLLSRANVRAREIAVRVALGARRRIIIRQLLTESLVLSGLGGALGVALAYGGVGLLLRFGGSALPRMETVSVDSRVLLFSAAIILCVGVLVGLAPAARLALDDLRSLMNEGGRGRSGSLKQRRVFRTLVAGEVALAVILVIGAGLLVRSYANLTATDPGFNAARVLTFALELPMSRVEVRSSSRNAQGKYEYVGAGYQPVAAFYSELIRRIESLPGVESVAASSTLPLSGDHIFNWDNPEEVNLVGADPSTASLQRGYHRRVTSNFFSTMGMRLVAGRPLQPADRRGSMGVVVVNEAFARHFPGSNPLGRHLKYDDTFQLGGVGFGYGERLVEDVEIVGVVADVKYVSLTENAEPAVYFSHEQSTPRRMAVVVRTAFDEPESLVPVIRREISAMDPLLPTEFALYSNILDSSIARQRLGMLLFVIFGAIALVLAAVGIYGVMAYAVSQRSAEIAVRAAMGASSGQLLRQLLREGFQPALAGIVLGLAGAVALRGFVASQLYAVSVLDLRVFVLVPVVLVGVALLASFLPAWRASKLDPARLFRVD